MDNNLHRYVDRLVREDPNKAIDILTECCYKDLSIGNRVIQHLANFPHQADSRSQTSGPEMSPSSTTSSSRHQSDLKDSIYPTGRNAHARRSNSFAAVSTTPLSPPRTLSPSMSINSTKTTKGSAENIIVFGSSEDNGKEWPLRMRRAPVATSVIQLAVVQKRRLDEDVRVLESPEQILIPTSKSSEEFVNITVHQSVELTWRPRKSDSTEVTTFYIVDHGLDADILLGYNDTADTPADSSPTIAPQPQRRQHYYSLSSPVAPIRLDSRYPSQSNHPTASYSGISANSTMPSTIFSQQKFPQQNAKMGVDREYSVNQSSSAATILNKGSPQSFVPHLPPLRTDSNDPFYQEPSEAMEKIRLKMQWGDANLSIWFFFSWTSEEFFKVFQQKFGDRVGFFERNDLTIFFKPDAKSPDRSAQELPLDAETMEADWNGAMEFLKKNRKSTSPHMFGRVEVGSE